MYQTTFTLSKQQQASKRNAGFTFMVLFFSVFLSLSNDLLGQQYDLITDSVQMYWPASEIPKPEYLQSIIDPDFGVAITRIAGDPGTPVPVVGGTWKDIARHGYSKRAAWNADESILMLDRHKWDPNPLFLDGDTYEVLFSIDLPGNEHRWHPTNPNLMLIAANSSVSSWNVRTSELLSLITFTGYSDCLIGPYEGNLSNDGNMIALYATRLSDGKKVGFALDLLNQIKHPDIDLSSMNTDWISISPLGNYLVLNGYLEGGDDQTQVYDLNGVKIGDLWSQYGRPSHYDLAVDDHGDEVAVGVSKSSPDNGRIIKRRLTDGKVTVLTKGGYATHTSTRCLGRQGWAFSSFNHRGPSNWEPYYNEIIAVKLDGSRAERICHIRGLWKDYENEAHPCPSPSGGRVLFASDWDNGAIPAQAYVADFRDKLIAGLELNDYNRDYIRVYPNPVSEFLIIPASLEGFEYRILTVTGTILKEEIVKSTTLDFSIYQPGMYIVEFTQSEENRRISLKVARK